MGAILMVQLFACLPMRTTALLVHSVNEPAAVSDLDLLCHHSIMHCIQPDDVEVLQHPSLVEANKLLDVLKQTLSQNSRTSKLWIM